MELDLQSLFGLHVYSRTHWQRPRNPPSPALGYNGAVERVEPERMLLCVKANSWSIH